MSLRIIVVEDNLDIATAFAALFRVDGHDVSVCRSGLEALELAKSPPFVSQPPNIVLIDIGLPTIDGWELAKRLRQLPGWEIDKVALIACTARADLTDALHSHDTGFNKHMVKPVEPDELLKVIHEYDRPTPALSAVETTNDAT